MRAGSLRSQPSLPSPSSRTVDAAGPPRRSVPRPPWWINPLWYSLFFLLPFFLIAVTSAGPYMLKLGQKVNNLSDENIMLGVLSIGMFAAGCAPLTWRRPPIRRDVVLPGAAVNRTLLIMGWTAALCYGIYFSSLVSHPALVVRFLAGSPDAMYQVRRAMEQIPGVTSFMHADLPFFSLYSMAGVIGLSQPLAKGNHKLFRFLVACICIRGLLGSERLALVEAAVAYAVPRVAFTARFPTLRAVLPYLGIVGVFALFCLGEYYRSWQYYRMYYPSYWDFISVRFFGYFATSINNGAGVVSHHLPLYFPAETADGFYKLLKIFGAEYNPGDVVVNNYLLGYATPEFNNPGGLYMPYLDYGMVGGSLCFLLMGLFTGLLYRRFLTLSPLAMMLYPSWYLALLDIIRVWIWGSSRFVPVIMVAGLAAASLRLRRRKAGC